MDLSARLTTIDAGEDWSRAWAASGAMGLSGRADGPPLPVPSGLVAATTHAAAVVAEASQRCGREVAVDGPALLGERAALAGLRRNGSTSCGGATRLVPAGGEWIAVSLARDSDRELIPAWLELDGIDIDDIEALWGDIATVAARTPARHLVERASLLSLPCSRAGETIRDAPLVGTRALDQRRATRSIAGALVVDLSSLWAGPLCANLLGLAGARVVKVESARRPDGARGTPAFFDLLHGGHESVVLDFADADDVAMLQRLIDRADIVIESSRPRALAQLGVRRTNDTRPAVWLRITAHGREAAGLDRVGFGDDAAVAGGLITHDDEGLCFCADAAADPATGLVAAAAVLDRWCSSGTWDVDVALSRTAAWLAAGALTVAGTEEVAPPRHRPITGRAPDLGADTDALLRELGTW